ncbi:unnamed protein product [Danaus chrysippus]|uniref:(African queen) hypothetical protein n=1 Tax=Danaus chrysippus TaxID=151541 RepID=A0A8J2QDB6_9NEOP|nr:unnamed protein product [Danaus chrysippus]
MTDDSVEEQPLKTEVKNEFKKMSLLNKLRFMRSNVTVEPVLALFVMPSVLAVMATQNLNLDKACRVNLDFPDEVCTNLRLRKRENISSYEDEVQKLIASVQAWKSVIHTAVPTLLMLFIGAWSDKTGRRKICMTMPIIGEFITCVLNMVNTYFFYEVSVEWTVFMEVIFPSLTGGWYTILLGTYSYLGDITSKNTRTFRLGILSLCMTVGFPLGMGFSGLLLKYIGYYGVFSLSALLQFFNFCYVTFRIKDHTWLNKNEEVKKSGAVGFFMEFFDIDSIKETFKIVFRKGPNNRRLRICLILAVVCLSFGPMWGTMFAISVFSKRLGVDDSVLGIISTTSKMAGALVTAFARSNYEIYAAPLVEILDGTTTIALRSIASKLVSHQELGKVFSLFGVAETMMPLIFAPLYSRVYILTLHILPGAVFLFTVLATVPAVGIFIWFYGQHKKDLRKKILEMQPPQVHEEAKSSDSPTA